MVRFLMGFEDRNEVSAERFDVECERQKPMMAPKFWPELLEK